MKVNPLADWTHDNVWSYIRENNVPYNALARPGLSEHRLRALHPRRSTW